MDECEDQEKLDALVRDLARCGGVSERSAWRLVQDLFFHEEVTDHYVRTEVGFVTIGLSTIDPGPPLVIQELPQWALDRGWDPVSGLPPAQGGFVGWSAKAGISHGSHGAATERPASGDAVFVAAGFWQAGSLSVACSGH